ncbi:MAG: hypothetical protein QOD77_423 [Thermoplasmata archaeon]|jgi:hypothetical protein|nr:hypothetical protein [Thermoplasmata archaeon]
MMADFERIQGEGLACSVRICSEALLTDAARAPIAAAAKAAMAERRAGAFEVQPGIQAELAWEPSRETPPRSSGAAPSSS